MNSTQDEHETAVKKWVWVPCKKGLYKQAYVLSEGDTSVRVQAEEEEVYSSADVHRMNPGKFDLAENLSCLSHLNEPSVLHNLEMRYKEGEIYTHSGLFLLSVNPYRAMGIYGEKIKEAMRSASSKERPPHVFGVAEEAYRAMIANRASQSILITGESGAGKTENTKRVIEYLAYVGGGGRMARVEAALMSANPILEAFGNAKTLKNDNSSRFGKFIQVKFRDGAVCGAKIEKYLLEKSRVTASPAGERSFHIFYYLLAGAGDDLLEKLNLSRSPKDYGALRRTVHEIANVDDAAEFRRLGEAFRELGVDDALEYYRTVAAVLHLSNVRFADEEEKATLVETGPIEKACELLGVSPDKFISALLDPIITAGNERVVYHRTRKEALAVLEGVMKVLYESLFDSLIAMINQRLDCAYDTYIGILDIAGFEIFKTNSFEQLCINYTNEKLQQYFNHHMFVLEQEAYKREEIEWDFIDFGLDLEPTIRTIEASNPIGILSYLDEECVMPGASDSTLLDKIRRIRGVEHVPFRNSFCMKHYAGKVEYEVEGWLSKNKDSESEELVRLLASNGMANSGAARGFIKKGIFKTVAQSHREGLRWLMETLKGTQPHFVRCILPNLNKSSAQFDRRLVLDQLRCNGVLEGIRISRLGYPTRIPFAEFIARYDFIAPAPAQAAPLLPRDAAIALLGRLGRAGYRVGRTMVFFRQGVVADLEEMREKKMQRAASEIQKLIRARIAIRRETLEAERTAAGRRLQADARIALQLLRWKWWRLFQRVQPLLDVRKGENERKKTEEELAQLRQRLAEAEAAVAGYQEKLDAGRREMERQRMDSEDLQNALRKMEGELVEKEGLLAALRNEAARVPVLAEETKRLEGLVFAHAERLEAAEVREENHSVERARLDDQIAEMGRELARKCEELDFVAKQDLGSVLKSKEEEIERMRAATAELSKRNGELARAEAAKSGECQRQALELEQLRKRESELGAAAERSAHQLATLTESSGAAAAKFRAELSDLHLENERLAAQCLETECALRAAEGAVQALEGSLEYQKARNSSLETSLDATTRALHAVQEKASEAREPEAGPESKVMQKEIAALKSKLENERRLCARLAEEKEELHKENLTLMQSKLDDLFNTEAAFSTAKAGLQSEIRRLEAENAAMQKELKAGQSVSDSSDESGFERMSAMLNEEQRQRAAANKRVFELEGINLRLGCELEAARREMERLAKEGATGATAGVRAELDALRADVSSFKRRLGSVRSAFQNDFFAVLRDKDEFYAELIAEAAEENRRLAARVAELEEQAHESARTAAALESLKKRLAQKTTELEAATVAGRLAAVTISELKAHQAKLEEAYEAREIALTRIKGEYQDAREELDSAKAELATAARRVREEAGKKSRAELDAALQAHRRAAADRAAALIQENERLREQADELGFQLTGLKAENAELASLVDSLSSVSCQPRGLAEHCSERLVSTFVVDKDALKAAEWKCIVSQKCQQCSEMAIPRNSDEIQQLGLEVAKLSNDNGLLGLKLRQAERSLEESRKIIEAMRGCVGGILVMVSKHLLFVGMANKFLNNFA